MRTILTILLLVGPALAQEETDITEPNVPQEVAPGVTVTVTTGAASREPVQVARAVIVYPQRIHGAIPYDREVVTLTLQVTSRVHTDVVVRHSGSLVARDSPEVRLPPGSTVSIDFTAFEAHEGTISVYNTEGDLLETIPYVVTKEARFRQTVRGSASTGVTTDFNEIATDPVDLRFGYGIRERSSGVGGQAVLGYEAGGNLDLDVSVSGSYNW